jgi:hypothetical protein
MRPRVLGTVMLALLVIGIMGAGGSHSPGPGVLESLPALARAGVDPALLTRASLGVVGVPAAWSEDELVGAVTRWRDRNQRALCGHAEAHELTGTPCSLAVGGPLDSLLDEVLATWVEAGAISPAIATLLYGSLPPHLAATHDLVEGRLQARVQRFTAEDLAAERSRLVAEGLSAAARWTPEAVARTLRRRTAGVDLVALAKRLNPEGVDLRRLVMEGWIRPLGLVSGRSGVAEASAALQDDVAEEPSLPAPMQAAAPVQEPPAPAPEPVEPPAGRLPAAESPVASEEPAALLGTSRPDPAPAPAARSGFAVAYGGTRFQGMRGER